MTRLASIAFVTLLAGCGFDSQVDLGAPQIPIPGQAPDAGPSTPGEPEPEPEPGDPCGDGVRTSGEACDDGNQQAGDGCSSQCTIENGYLCDGGECEQASELFVDEPFAAIGISFGLTEIERADCDEGVLVGFAGEVNPGLGLRGLRGICADLPLDAGKLNWEESGTTDLLGSQGQSLVGTICQESELLVGIKIFHTTVSVVGLAPICAQAGVSGGQVVISTPTTRERIGSEGLFSAERLCADGQAAASRFAADPNTGGFGALGLRCGTVFADTE